MTNESSKNRMQDIWQCQPVEGIKMSVEEIRSRAGKFENKVVWRNVREYVAGAIVAVFCGLSFASTHDLLTRSAFAALIAGTGYVMYQLHRKGRARNMPGELGNGSSLQFYRGELERQRDLISNVWPWYLAPVIPGLILLAIASAVHNPQPRHIAEVVFGYGLIAAFFVFVWKLNARAARRLQRMIDDLPASEQA